MSTVTWIACVAAFAGLPGYVAVALCVAARRTDRAAQLALTPPPAPAAPDRVPARIDAARTTACRARAALRGRTAWTFASPCPHARLRMAERDGSERPPPVEAHALRVAGLAINGALPVIVPSADDATTVAVPIPFADGRMGALVVTTTRWTSLRPWAVAALEELAAEHAADVRIPEDLFR